MESKSKDSQRAEKRVTTRSKSVDEAEPVNRFKAGVEKVFNKVQHIKREVVKNKEVAKLASKLDSIMSKRENPQVLVRLDQILFSLGIFALLITFTLIFYPKVTVLASWITMLNSLLLFIRYFEYRSKDWHYYFFDFCYAVNVATWVFIWFFPKSPLAFFLVALNATGPILNYFIIFSGKLVFQSLEALTSFFMHYTPAMLFWVLRYHNTTDTYFVTRQEIEDYLWAEGWRSQLKVFGISISFYMGWILFYYLMIFHVRKQTIKECGFPTLFSHTVEDIKSFNGFILFFGSKWSPVCYMVLHLVQGCLGTLVSMVIINSYGLSILLLVVYLALPIRNSSIYYFEYFSRDYHNKIHVRADQYRQQRIKRSTSEDKLTSYSDSNDHNDRP